jgi:hypothetical protein
MYFLTRGAVGGTVAVLLMIGAMLPMFFFAMYEKDGMPAEKILSRCCAIGSGRAHGRTKRKTCISIWKRREKPCKQTANRTATAPAQKRPAGKGK